MLGERGYDASAEAALVEAVIARRPDGIVLTGMMQTLNPSLPVNSVQELMAYGKQNPDKLNFASSGARLAMSESP